MKANWTYLFEDATNQAGELTRERAAYLLRAARSRGPRNVERVDDGYNIVDAKAIIFRLPSLDAQLAECQPQWESLVAALIPDIDDDYRASDDPDDDIPGMGLTVGFTPATPDKDASWSYQTGDNSYTGGAYGHPHWAVVSLFRDSDAQEIAEEIASQIGELVCS